MNNFPSYPNPNQPGQPDYPQPGGFAQPTMPAFPPGQSGDFSQTGYQYQQPGDVTQPGFQPSAPPKQRRTGLWITLIVILVLLIVGGGIFTYLQLRSTPQKTLQAYCTGLKNDDAQAIYNTYSSEDQARTSLDNLRNGLRILNLLLGSVKDCVVQDNSIQENGSQASGMIAVTFGRLVGSRNITMDLVDENGQWKIQNNAKLPGAGSPS